RDENLELDEVSEKLEGLQVHPRRKLADDDRRLDADDIVPVSRGLVTGGRGGGRRRGRSGRRFGHQGWILLAQHLRNRGDDRFRRFARRTLLFPVVREEVEGFALGVLHGLDLGRFGPLAFTARGGLPLLNEIEHLALRRRTVAFLCHQAGSVLRCWVRGRRTVM